MSKGRNEEALQVFRTIFKINTGKPADEYPVSLALHIEFTKTKLSEKSKVDSR